ncbi:hypothetical protein N7492_008999 [Penicillium capsulatum]|uniref:Uncharacterized protein n=1 Tax=Penicillium capsulatum TaxID=69766 RepID=A0A9W9HRP9_9EURO|nr:hypothetical protein N7492_008999 [Penicillium capsulatum]
MCTYRGIWHKKCGHCIFDLHAICRGLLQQLNRINAPDERDVEYLPFDELPECNPHALIMRATADIAVSSYAKDGANVVEWVTELREECPQFPRGFLRLRREDNSQI